MLRTQTRPAIPRTRTDCHNLLVDEISRELFKPSNWSEAVCYKEDPGDFYGP